MIRSCILILALTTTSAVAQPILNLTPPVLALEGTWACAADGERFSTDPIVVYEADGTFEMQFDYASTTSRSGSYRIAGTAQGTYELPTSGSIFETLTSVQIDHVSLEGEATDDPKLLEAFEASLVDTYPSQTSFVPLSDDQIIRIDGSLANGLCDRTS